MTTREAGRITVSGLTKRFGRVTAVDGLTFTAAPGAVTGFLGPNGAGKTTTLRMLAGLVIPDAGAATIGGHAYSRLAAPGREAGVVLEAAGFHPARRALRPFLGGPEQAVKAELSFLRRHLPGPSPTLHRGE